MFPLLLMLLQQLRATQVLPEHLEVPVVAIDGPTGYAARPSARVLILKYLAAGSWAFASGAASLRSRSLLSVST